MVTSKQTISELDFQLSVDFKKVEFSFPIKSFPIKNESYHENFRTSF